MSIRHRAADDDRARLRHADPPLAPRTLPLLPPLLPLSQARRAHHAHAHHAANRIARRKTIEDSRSQRQAEGFTRRHAGLEARQETRCGVGLRQRGNSGQHPESAHCARTLAACDWRRVQICEDDAVEEVGGQR
jgi:hypothetical protein